MYLLQSRQEQSHSYFQLSRKNEDGCHRKKYPHWMQQKYSSFVVCIWFVENIKRFYQVQMKNTRELHCKVKCTQLVGGKVKWRKISSCNTEQS